MRGLKRKSKNMSFFLIPKGSAVVRQGKRPKKSVVLFFLLRVQKKETKYARVRLCQFLNKYCFFGEFLINISCNYKKNEILSSGALGPALDSHHTNV